MCNDQQQGGTVKRYTNPYIAGIALGFVLFASFFLTGKGLGGSGAWSRLAAEIMHFIAPAHIENSPYFGHYFAHGKNPLHFWLVFLAIGTFFGGLFSSFIHGRSTIEVNRGPRISVQGRLVYALVGGILVGFASRLGLGCTSGQGLAGASVLSLGSWAFLFSVFFGGYATAYFVKDGWL